MTGLVKIDLWAAALDTTPNTGVFFAAEKGQSTSARSALFGFRLGKIDYNNGGAWTTAGPAYEVNRWYHFTALINYNTKTWDFYVDGSLVAGGLSFWHPAAATQFDNIRIFKQTAATGMVIDELNIVPEPSSLLALGAGVAILTGSMRRRKR